MLPVEGHSVPVEEARLATSEEGHPTGGEEVHSIAIEEAHPATMEGAQPAIEEARGRSIEEDYEHYEDDHYEDAALDEYIISQKFITLDEAVNAPQERYLRKSYASIGDRPFQGEDKYESEGRESLDESDEEELERKFQKKKGKKLKRPRFSQFHKDTPFDQVAFQVGMEFNNLATFKQAVKDYAVAGSYALKFVKNDKRRIRVKCSGDCPFVIYCALDVTSE